MSRVSRSHPHNALEHAAQLIRNAAGDDNKVTRSEMNEQLEQLDGAERKLADMFYRYSTYRSGSSPNRVVDTDKLDEIVEYAKSKLIDKYDLNDNGLSKSEIKQMSNIGKLAVEVGHELDIRDRQNPDPEVMSRIFEAQMDGAYYISEGDYPYKGFHLKAPESGEAHNLDTFREMLGVPADIEISTDSAEEFFELYQDPDGYGSDPDEAWQYGRLEGMMTDNLRDLQVIHVGNDDQVEGKVFIVGTAHDNSLVGLETTRIWT